MAQGRGETSGLADTSLVIAAVQDGDALHSRALSHLERTGRLVMPHNVGIELLLGARAKGSSCVDVLAACEKLFDVEARDALLTAASALDTGKVRTVFDAVHLAEAFHRGLALHTAGATLSASGFPVEWF